MRKLVTNEAGNVAAIAAITVFGVAIGAGFAMNMNRMETTADYLQRVADSAAIGAVVAGQDRTRSDAEVKVAGNALAAAMLTARHGSAKVNTAVEDREPTRVTVQITEDIDMIFGGLMSRTTQTLTRTATAENQAAVPVCLLVLNPTAPGAVKLQGSPQIRTQSCSVHVNSAQRARSRSAAPRDRSHVDQHRRPAQPRRQDRTEAGLQSADHGGPLRRRGDLAGPGRLRRGRLHGAEERR
jgi:hypothetical protein